MQKEQTIREVVFYGLLEEILTGQILPGEKLLEAKIAAQYKVSRTPVREAILQLNQRGVVEHRPNVGAIVKKFSHGEILESLDVIAVLEGMATGIAVESKLTDEDIAILIDINDEIEEVCKDKSYLSYWVVNEKFHNFFTERCGNNTLLTIVSGLRKKIFRTGLTTPMYSDQYLLDHRKITEAVKTRDAAKAGELMKEHSHNIRMRFSEVFEILRKQNIAI